ncbi:type VI secretion system baseplate subunit TssF [Desulfonema magnum]|uniref:Type VI secretion protein domain-containing protein, TssF-like n=1 Tax=Desulfonema magnum TaxID=45655 RepID=A0A975BI38_9BACT|nr:type VI secretion system baseplate subunit TssF [Desulfonema magnum]QTA85802.1 Type VI secretion protein domain-containing protein, TssF-like [Desulfonema magnum]
MNGNNKSHMLEYYQQELTYLRKMGAEFAEQYPKVAGRLEMGTDRSPDPHIERLIESFAFLTARIQYNLESEFPRLSTALLGVLYPQFLNPVPCMTVARFEVDPGQLKLTSRYSVEKHTPLFTQTEQGHICRFRTCYPIDLWPVEVTEAEFEAPDKYEFMPSNVFTVLRLRIKSQTGSFDDLAIPHLRFYLNGERMLVNDLYELLFGNVIDVAVLAPEEDTSPPVFLTKNAILPVGFRPEEDVLPYPPNAHAGYRLLHEYFTFPEKYLFFDLDFQKGQRGENNTSYLPSAGDYFDILIMTDQPRARRLTIDKNTFCLGCTPIINLFHKTTDPIRLDQQRVEYPLVPDKRREKTTEIHSVLSVSETTDSRDKSGAIEPFFSFNHQMEKKENKAFWFARREPEIRKDIFGTRMVISFVDLDFNPGLPPASTVYAHTLCTNRNLAEDLPTGALLQIERSVPVSRIFTLDKPTRQIDPPLEGATLWRLISHLSLNYLSLSDSDESLESLKEIIRLYDLSERMDACKQGAGIREMSCKKIVRRFGPDAWRGFCRGTEITMIFNEGEYEGGSSAFLFGAVLNSFFPLYASVNSFTQLIIKSQKHKGIWKRWEPMVGEQMFL